MMNSRSIRRRVRASMAASLLFALVTSDLDTALADVAPAAAPAPATNVGAVAMPQPTPAEPVYGDLTHLTFTATKNLVASFIYPHDGFASDSIAPTFEVATVEGAGVELAVNDKIVPFSKIGKRTVAAKTGETHYLYYGVALEEGLNTVTITPLGADGLRGPSVSEKIYGPGHAVRITGSIVGSPVADGKTPVIFRVAGFDRYGHHAAPGATIKLTIVRGDAHFLALRDRASAALAQGASGALASPGPVVGIAVPQSQGTPFPFSSPGPDAVPTGGPQQGEVANPHAIGDLAVPVQSIEVPLGDGGIAEMSLIPGLQPGEIRIRASVADVSVETQAYVAPYLRKAMVLGLATTGVGSVPGVPGELATQADGANSRMGRIAIYGVGQITKTAQAQVAYDTADVLQNTSQYGSFTDNPQETPYLTYGDSSQRRDDALSNDHLYARIDSNRSNIMWGEFQANTAGSTGDGFQQLVDGAKVEIAGNNAKLTAFNSHNDVAYARQVFSPTGLATIGALLHPDIVVGSDTVTLVALDRRTGAVIAQTVLGRNIDYTIDYGTGQIRFINPPLPFDLNFNPQQLLIQYEYGGAGVSAQTTGGRFEAGIGGSQAVRIGAGYVNDSTGSGNYALLGEDITGKLSGGSWTFVHENSQGSLADLGSTGGTTGDVLSSAQTQGNAYRATLTQTSGANHISLNFDSTSAGYDNPFGGLSTAGLLDYRVAYQRLLSKSTDSITISFDHEQNNLPTGINSTSNASILAQQHLTKRVTLRAGVNVLTSNGTTVATNSALDSQINTVPTAAPVPGVSAPPTAGPSTTTTQVDVGAEYKVAPQVDLSLDRITSLSGPQQASQPSQTTAQVSVDTPDHGKAYIRELFADAPVQSFAAATTSLTTASSSTRSTAVGLEQSLGANTTVDTEYAIEDTGSGSDVYSSIGGHEKFFLGKNLHGDFQLQHAASIGANGGAFDLYGLTLAYAVGSRFRATTDYQLRTGNASGYTLTVGAAGALSDNVSMFVTSNNSTTAGYSNVDDQFSLAYRPSLNDRAVTLFGYQAIDGDVSNLGDHTQLLSLEELYRPDHLLEIAGRYAYKLDGDAYYPARSSLFGIRVTQRLSHRFDVAAETRFLSAHDVPGASTTGFAVEAGYRLGGEMRVAAGYNFAGSPDPSLALAPTRRGVYATATSVIDRIFGWGKDDDL
jgi:hypothetical protein